MKKRSKLALFILLTLSIITDTSIIYAKGRDKPEPRKPTLPDPYRPSRVVERLIAEGRWRGGLYSPRKDYIDKSVKELSTRKFSEEFFMHIDVVLEKAGLLPKGSQLDPVLRSLPLVVRSLNNLHNGLDSIKSGLSQEQNLYAKTLGQAFFRIYGKALRDAIDKEMESSDTVAANGAKKPNLTLSSAYADFAANLAKKITSHSLNDFTRFETIKNLGDFIEEATGYDLIELVQRIDPFANFLLPEDLKQYISSRKKVLRDSVEFEKIFSPAERYKPALQWLDGENANFSQLIKKFQKKEHLPETGKLDQNTKISLDKALDALFLTSYLLKDIRFVPPKMLQVIQQEVLISQVHKGKYYLALNIDDTLKVYIIEGEKISDIKSGWDSIATLDTVTRAQVKKHSEQDLVFMHTSSYRNRDNEEITIQLGDRQLRVEPKKLEQFAAGKAPSPELHKFFSEIPSSSEKKVKIILYRDQLFRQRNKQLASCRSKMGLKQISPLSLTSALKRVYGNLAQFYLDDEMEAAQNNAENIPVVRGYQDLAVYMTGGFKNNDYGLMENLLPLFEDKKIKVIKDVSKTSEANIVILSGHKNEAFRSRLSDLAKAALLENKVVALFSCYQKGDENFNSQILMREGKARAIIFFPDAINAVAVEEVLAELADSLENYSSRQFNLAEIIDKCVDRVKRKTKNKLLMKEINKLRKGVLQVSHLQSVFGRGEYDFIG